MPTPPHGSRAASARLVPVSRPVEDDDELRVRLVVDGVRGMLRSGQVDVDSAIGVFRAATSLAASWDVAARALELLAAGADGVSGTDDDVIPEKTMRVISFLLRQGVVRDLVAWLGGVLSPEDAAVDPAPAEEPAGSVAPTVAAAPAAPAPWWSRLCGGRAPAA